MPVKVFSCCAYPAIPGSRSADQWTAVRFVRALKGRPFRGYSRVPLPGGGRAYLDARTAARATEWFGSIAAAGVTWHRVGALALVPIPNAACALTGPDPPRTLALAAALELSLPAGKAVVRDVLRWEDVRETAHEQGGTRDPQELYSALRLLRGRLSEEAVRYVLVDDVIASGAHIRAAAAFLKDCGARVLCAVCGGRAIYDGGPADPPFRIRTDVLPDFVPDPDWLLPFDPRHRAPLANADP